jgi:hypothetical protein
MMGLSQKGQPSLFLFEAELKSTKMRLLKMKKAEFTCVNEHF